MRRPRIARTLPVASLVLAASLLVACEEMADETPASPASAASSDGGGSGDDGARSAYGKAYERAERLEQEIQAYQEEVIKTADGVFDDSASRQRDD